MSPVLSTVTSPVLMTTLVQKNGYLYSINTSCLLFNHLDTNILDEDKKKKTPPKKQNKCQQRRFSIQEGI